MYIVFILQCEKVQKQLPNCMERAETSVILIVFNSVLYRISSYTFLTVTVHGAATRKALLGP